MAHRLRWFQGKAFGVDPVATPKKSRVYQVGAVQSAGAKKLLVYQVGAVRGNPVAKLRMYQIAATNVDETAPPLFRRVGGQPAIVSLFRHSGSTDTRIV